MFSFTHNYSCAVLYPLLYSRFPQITEQNLHKSPNKISTNHRTNLPQITEQIFHKQLKSLFSFRRTTSRTSIQNDSSYTLQVKYIAAVALPARRALLVRSTLLAAPPLYTLHSSFTRPQGLTRSFVPPVGGIRGGPQKSSPATGAAPFDIIKSSSHPHGLLVSFVVGKRQVSSDKCRVSTHTA